MAYEKQTFEDGQLLNAKQMNHIEEGIYNIDLCHLDYYLNGNYIGTTYNMPNGSSISPQEQIVNGQIQPQLSPVQEITGYTYRTTNKNTRTTYSKSTENIDDTIKLYGCGSIDIKVENTWLENASWANIAAISPTTPYPNDIADDDPNKETIIQQIDKEVANVKKYFNVGTNCLLSNISLCTSKYVSKSISPFSLNGAFPPLLKQNWLIHSFVLSSLTLGIKVKIIIETLVQSSTSFFNEC